MATDFLISFDDLKAGSAAVKRLVQAFTRAGATVASSDIDPKTRRTSGVNYRQVLITFTDNQKVLLGVKTTGDIFEVRVNGAALAIKNQDNQIKAVGEIAKALDAGRAKFQAKMARTKVALPKGITTAAPKMEQRLQEAESTLDAEIAAAKARVAELRAELGEPVMDSAASGNKPGFYVRFKDNSDPAFLGESLTAAKNKYDAWANRGAGRKLLDKEHETKKNLHWVERSHGIDVDGNILWGNLDLTDSMLDSAGELFAQPPEAWPTSWLGFRVVDDATVMDRAASALPSAHQLSAEVDLMLSSGDGGEMPLRGRVVRASFRAGKVNYDVALPIALDATGGVRAHAVIPDVDSALVRPAAGALDSVKAYAGEIRENASVLDSTHEAAGETFDGGEWDNLVAFAKRGKLEDGDIPAKDSRDTLVERGFVERGDGMNWLTDKGKEVAAALDSAGAPFDPKTDRWASTENGSKLLIRGGNVIGGAGGKLNSAAAKKEILKSGIPKSGVEMVKAARAILREKPHTVASFAKEAGFNKKKAKMVLETMVATGVLHDPTNNGRNEWSDDMKFHMAKGAYDSASSAELDAKAASVLDAVDVPCNSFDDVGVVEAQAIAARLAAGDTLDDADLSHARATLENALDTVETNYPINLAEGNIAQAELEENAAESFRAALKMLGSKEPLAA